MSRRVLALLVFLLAAAGWLLAGAPARDARDRARAEYARAREERQRQRASLQALERLASPPQPGAAGARALRRALLDATDGLALGGVSVDATAGERSGPRGRLLANGRTADVLALADRLARPGSGVALRRLEIAQVREDSAVVRFSAEVVSAGRHP